MKIYKEHLIELANYKMPYGKFKGKYLIELPEPYVVWLKNNALPKGKLGKFIIEIHEIKVNGLEQLIYPLIKR
ncbi:MAG: DUF3820 family protein [Crocinitomicaceae bacterium]